MIVNNENIQDYFNTMKRCTKCILPETFPGIQFDENGVCNYCKEYEPMNPFGEEKLIELLSKFRGKGKEYDILVPVSGGRDSSYVLHQIVKKYNMRAIAITVDSGFILEEGLYNLKVITNKLNVPHVVLRNNKRIEIAKRNTKIKFRGWVKRPSINTIIPVLNAGDKTMNFQMYKYAVNHDIPLMLGGNMVGNASVEADNWRTGYWGIFPNSRGTYSKADSVKLLLLYFLEFLKNTYNYKFSIFNEYFTGGLTYFFDVMRKPKDLVNIGFYDYIYWDEETIVNTIKEELGWISAPDTNFTWRIDDAAYPLINYLLYNLVGFTEHDEMNSRMILEGQISRKEALERLKGDHKPRLDIIERDLKEFEIAKEELDKSLSIYRKKLLQNILKKHYNKLEIV